MVFVIFVSGCSDGIDTVPFSTSGSSIGVKRDTDTEDIGPNLVGASFTDNKGNRVVVYIPDTFDYASVRMAGGFGSSDIFEFFTDQYIKITFPEGLPEVLPIRIYPEPANFDHLVTAFPDQPEETFEGELEASYAEITPYIGSEKDVDRYIEFRARPKLGYILVALVKRR